MSATFTELLSGAVFADGVLSLSIPAGWMQGRTTYGGLSAALCLETARRAFPDAPPLRSALVSFIGPAGGEVTGRAKLLRQGKSVTFIEAELSGEAGLATRCAFAFGDARPSQWSRTFTPLPDVPPPEDCAPFIPEGMGPPFAKHFEARLAKGGRPATGSKEHDHFIWVRHREEVAGPVALLAIADMPPPALMPMFTEFAPISSMTWMVNMLTDAPATRDGWWLLESRAEQAGGGYSSQDMLVWNRDGDLVIAGRQSVAVFS
jgi:acyl-CoA thioesterase